MRRAKVPRAQALALLRIRTAVRRTDVPRLSKSTIKKPTVRTSLCPDGRHSRHPRGMWSIPLPSAPRLLLFVFSVLSISVRARRVKRFFLMPAAAKKRQRCRPSPHRGKPAFPFPAITRTFFLFFFPVAQRFPFLQEIPLTPFTNTHKARIIVNRLILIRRAAHTTRPRIHL